MLLPRVPSCSPKELGDKIGLSPPEFKEFKTTLRNLAQEYLNTQKSWAEQREADTTKFLRAAQKSLPILRKYEESWPATTYIKSWLAAKASFSRTVASLSHRIQSNAGTKNSTEREHKQLPPITRGITDLGVHLHTLDPNLDRFLPLFVSAGIININLFHCVVELAESERRRFFITDVRLPPLLYRYMIHRLHLRKKGKKETM